MPYRPYSKKLTPQEEIDKLKRKEKQYLRKILEIRDEIKRQQKALEIC